MIKKILPKQVKTPRDLLNAGLIFGLIIAVPLLTSLPIAIWLDRKIGTTPLFILLSLLFSLVLSCIMLYKVICEIIEGEHLDSIPSHKVSSSKE